MRATASDERQRTVSSFAGLVDAEAAINGDFSSPSAAAPQARTRALIAPHIDFHRAGSTYAWAYREILARSDAAGGDRVADRPS